MAKKKISIKDIAKALGISITTVSFILNGKAREKRISEAMINKVQAYIKEVNYRPNHVAQSLRSGKSKVIVLMVEDISNTFFSAIAKNIEERAYKNGYKIIYCSTDNEDAKAVEMIETFKNRNVDGFIITPTPHLEKSIEDLIQEDFAVVLFDRWLPEVACSYVIVENEISAAEATSFMLKSGCKKVGFVTLESSQNQMLDRLKGYEKAISESNQDSLVFKLPFHNISDVKVSDKIVGFLQENPQLDGVLFATNYLAFEGLDAIRRLGLKIPDDVSVISFDDNYFFNLYEPTISAIAQPLELIADHLIQEILRKLDQDSTEILEVVLPTTLHLRNSTKSR
jgi:LacI family transcriptional regulator